MPSWAWRLGFVVAFIAGLLIFFLRTHVTETPEYQHIKSHEKLRFPFFEALKNAPFAIIGVIGIAWLTGIMTFGTYVFTATYLHTYFNISLTLATLIITLSLGVDALLEPFIAILADKIGLLRVIKFGMIALLLLSTPIFYLLAIGKVAFITVGMVLMSILIAITYAPLNAYMVSLFPHQYRYSGFGIAFNLGISLFGGTTPLVMMWLVNKTGNFLSPAWYYVFGAVIGLASLAVCEHGQRRATTLQPAQVY